MLTGRARAQICARPPAALVEDQKEYVALAGDDVVIVRNAVETVDQKASDVADRLLTVSAGTLRLQEQLESRVG